jgi:hypothetical protein
MKHQDKRHQVMRELAAQAVTIIELPNGFTRIEGHHGNVTVFDLAQLTQRQLQRFGRITK